MKKKTIKRILILVGLALFFGVLYYAVGLPMLAFVEDPDSLHSYIESRGIRGLISYCGLIVIQTMSSCIPGTPFYMAAGYVLGGLKGALLCDVSASLGNTFAFLLGKKFGKSLLENLFSEKQMDRIGGYINEGKPKMIHVMFMLLPLPKDAYAWFGYTSKEPVWQWFAITFLCRFPNIFLYSFSGKKIGEKQYGIFIVGAAVAVLFYVVGLIYLRRKKLANKQENTVKSKIESVAKYETTEDGAHAGSEIADQNQRSGV